MEKQNKLCQVAGWSLPDKKWLVMNDNWIIPAWLNYLIVNNRTAWAHRITAIDLKLYPNNTCIQVSEQDKVEVGDLLAVLYGSAPRESATPGCECDDCREGRKDPYNWITNGMPCKGMQAQHPPLSDEELNEIFQIVPPKETFANAFEEMDFKFWYDKYNTSL